MGCKMLYQTVDDRGNPDQVEAEGPFKCTKAERDPWLGDGYYFWENYIENAHWWGEKGYHNRYMICSASCKDSNIFDLTSGNLEHLAILKEYWQILLDRAPKKRFTVRTVLEHMMTYSGAFDYAAIRTDGINTANSDAGISKHRLYFPNKASYINLMPQIQICIIDKKRMELSGYKIVHPSEYCSDVVV